MPQWDYQCSKCDHIWPKYKLPLPVECPECSHWDIKRLISSPASFRAGKYGKGGGLTLGD